MTAQLTIKDFHVLSTNLEELKSLKKEIFDQHSYYFETTNPNPIIIDLGAHVGVSSFYFTSLYPTAQILAVEPNPIAFELLQRNLAENAVNNVTSLNAAVAARSGTQTLFVDTKDEWFSTASFIKGAWTQTQSSRGITVKAVTLSEIITTHFAHTPIDLVKMDIEGAEHLVLSQAGQELSYIKQLIVEYHPVAKHSLSTIADRLKKFGLLPEESLPSSPKKTRQLQLLRFSNSHQH